MVELEECSTEPLTGFFRDGCCNTGPEDVGSHTVCTRVTEEFLDFSLSQGNDLLTPMPQYGFRASSRATSGASAPPAGPRPWGRASRASGGAGRHPRARPRGGDPRAARRITPSTPDAVERRPSVLSGLLVQSCRTVHSR